MDQRIIDLYDDVHARRQQPAGARRPARPAGRQRGGRRGRRSPILQNDYAQGCGRPREGAERSSAGGAESSGGRRDQGHRLPRPAGGGRREAARRSIVIHENRGLNATHPGRRPPAWPWTASSPSPPTCSRPPSGGTPAAEDKARAMIGALDPGPRRSPMRWRRWRSTKASETHPTGKAGAVGFCWGGGMVNALAIAASDVLKAGVRRWPALPARRQTPRSRRRCCCTMPGVRAHQRRHRGL